MSFDTSDTAREKILDSVKIHTTLGEDTPVNASLRERFIKNLFDELKEVVRKPKQFFFLKFLDPFQLKKGPYQVSGTSVVSHGRQLFSDIANAVCRNHATEFHCIEDGSSRSKNEEYGRYIYSWNYGRFHISITTFRSGLLEFIVSVSDVGDISDNDTDTEESVGSLYTIIRNLHSRLSILESRYSSQG